jgi:hypothetical protein
MQMMELESSEAGAEKAKFGAKEGQRKQSVVDTGCLCNSCAIM